MNTTSTVIAGRDRYGQLPLLVRILYLTLLLLFLMPWLLMTAGLLYVGIGSLFRKDWQELRLCLPAGIALTVAIAGVFWWWLRSPRRIHEFSYAEGFLEFVTKPGAPSVMREVAEIAKVSEYFERRSAGYLIQFRDGQKIAVNRHVPNAARLYAALQEDVSAEK